MTALLIGFDSAWTRDKTGGVVGVLRDSDGEYREIGAPQAASFADAERLIRSWQDELLPERTLVLLDQPTIVGNAAGQRPVENIVCSSVSRRYGGVQPASTSREEMFGPGAPIWGFLSAFDDAQDPLAEEATTRVLETYPALAMIALGWTLPDDKRGERLPKYNPDRRKTFALSEWEHVCKSAASALEGHCLSSLSAWMYAASRVPTPRKQLQDRVDACICLLIALHLAEGGDALMIGNAMSGYMVVPNSDKLRGELEARCEATQRSAPDWIRVFSL